MKKGLRDYQREMLERLHQAWAGIADSRQQIADSRQQSVSQQRSVMVQMPTGTGKTYLMAEVIRENMAHGVLIVAHRVELIGQISQTLDSFDVPHGIIDRTTADIDSVTREHKVCVASIQTLARRIDPTPNPSPQRGGELLSGGTFPQKGGELLSGFNPQLVIVDEAHHAVAKTYRLLWDKWPQAKFLGLTATPCRLNDTGFTDLFDTLLESYSIQEFIDRGWLSDFDYVSVTPDNWMVERIAGLKKRGVDGDYQTKEMATVMDSKESIEHLYRSYEQYAKGKKGIVYAISREHAQHIADYYRQMGVRCCWIEALTPAEERQRLVEDYRQGRMDVIVNVDIFSEGFDCPEVEFIQLARPTLSLSKYLQQVGRGMRAVPHKDYVVILDQVGMYQTFGMPTEERDWSLMFRGKIRGRGRHGGDRRYIIRDEPDLTLLNLKMVHIKRHGEKSNGMEVFIQGGRYGILNDGKVVCAPEFEKVQRLQAPYFVMGIYPYYVFRNRVDIIDMEGRVMKPGLYGNVKMEGDVFIGEDSRGRRDYWDAKGGRHYGSMPQFGRILRFEVARDGEQIYMRQLEKGWEKPFTKDSVLLHERYVIMGNKLIFLDDTRKAYEICGYERGCVYIQACWKRDERYKYASVGPTGTITAYEHELPGRLRTTPVDIGMMKLKRMS